MTPYNELSSTTKQIIDILSDDDEDITPQTYYRNIAIYSQNHSIDETSHKFSIAIDILMAIYKDMFHETNIPT